MDHSDDVIHDDDIINIDIISHRKWTASEEVGQGQKVINHLNIPQLKSALGKVFGLGWHDFWTQHS